ncbi:MAG: rhomboid family intramembrane serine protease [Pyrinomonadaceae bacterium]
MNLEGRPSLCRKCGAIVGAGQNTCTVCGADAAATSSISPNQPRRAYDLDAMRFARAVLNRSYIFTILFLVANFFVFLLMWQSSGMNSGALWVFPQEVLQAYGAKLNFLIKQDHQWWRFVTPVFIHVNVLHLLVNMYSLWMIGPYVEKLYGSAKFVVFWVVTGVAGVVASYLTVRPEWVKGLLGSFVFKARDDPSVGASGALFGLIGVLFVFGIKFRRELPEGFKRAFGTGLLPVILINLFIGFMARGFIDNAAHLGGLVSGAAMALVVDYKRPGERATITITWRALQVLSLALVAVSFFMVQRHFRDPYRAGPNPIPLEASTNEHAVVPYLNAINEGQRAFEAAVSNKIDQEQFQHALMLLDQSVGPDQTGEALRTELKALLLRARNLSVVPERNRRQTEFQAQTKKLYQDYEAWTARRDKWINETGKTYGIELVTPEDTNTNSGAEKPASSPAR